MATSIISQLYSVSLTPEEEQALSEVIDLAFKSLENRKFPPLYYHFGNNLLQIQACGNEAVILAHQYSQENNFTEDKLRTCLDTLYSTDYGCAVNVALDAYRFAQHPVSFGKFLHAITNIQYLGAASVLHLPSDSQLLFSFSSAFNKLKDFFSNINIAEAYFDCSKKHNRKLRTN
jgi:hypothetical protein